MRFYLEFFLTKAAGSATMYERIFHMPTNKPRVSDVAIIFLVKNLERTSQFYATAIGLKLEEQEGYCLITMPNGTEILFFEGEAEPGGFPQVVFGLEEGGIETIAEGLAELGAQMVTPVSEAPGGWSMEFKDPDGHALAFFQAESLPKRI